MTTAREPGRLLGVAGARRVADEARAGVCSAVAAARSAGHSWAEIGTVLGVTRQAAFKRFGTPRDPRTAETMTPTPLGDLLTRTEEVFARIDSGDYDAVLDQMPSEVAAVLTREVVLGTWRGVVAETGNLEQCRDTRLEHPDGSAAEPDGAALGLVVGHTELVCEAGIWTGRVAFDDRHRIVGLLILVPGATDAPF